MSRVPTPTTSFNRLAGTQADLAFQQGRGAAHRARVGERPPLQGVFYPEVVCHDPPMIEYSITGQGRNLLHHGPPVDRSILAWELKTPTQSKVPSYTSRTLPSITEQS